MAQRSKWFRVAFEGVTTDKRDYKITAKDISDCVETFNRDAFAPRVNLEHFRGILPGGPFDMLGDVISLRSEQETLTIAGEQKTGLAMYAEIEPLPELITLNQKKQKIFTSVEIDPDFARSGKAGLMGLAVTDSPASFGTQILEFSAQNPDYFKDRKQSPTNMFTAAQEVELEFHEVADNSADPAAAGAFAAIKTFFTGLSAATPAPAGQPAQPSAQGAAPPAVVPPAGAPPAGQAPAQPVAADDSTKVFAAQMGSFVDTVGNSIKALADAQKATDAKITHLTQQLEAADTSRFTRRPAATGGDERKRAVY